MLIGAYGEIGTSDIKGKRHVRAPFENGLLKAGYPAWKNAISRLVLLAPMTRGWSIDSVKSRIDAYKWRVGAFVGHLLFSIPTIFDIRRGAPFLVQTRLQWLELMRAEEQFKPQNLIVVQLLGTIDNLVSPDDNLDFSIDRGRNFYYVSVPYSSHTSIIDLDKCDHVTTNMVACRIKLITAALIADAETLESHSTPLEHLADLLPLAPKSDVKHAVFVVHGIRDLGFWTQKIAARIKQTSNGEWKSITPSYGYFTMAQFLFWWIRKQKVEWLMDQYVEARANFPNAEFDYVGHSNGTYLLAGALTHYPAARFRNVVFAGSVVRSSFQWPKCIVKGQVQRVLNYVATADLVVAIAPSAVRHIPKFDLGGAGVTGFKHQGENINNLFYVRGKHSAALVESQWDEIANFVVNSRVPNRNNTDFEKSQDPLVKWIGILSPLIAIVFLYLSLIHI